MLLHASMNGPPPPFSSLLFRRMDMLTQRKKGDGRVLLRRARKRGGKVCVVKIVYAMCAHVSAFLFLI